jgi:transposase
VNHAAGEYVRLGRHTNSVESMWSILRRGINGTYIHVSQKWLQTYLWEFEFRYNLRKSPHVMFDLLVRAFPQPVRPSPQEAGESAA